MANKYVNRTLEGLLKKAVKQFPALIVTGPRQSGKTTLLKHLFSQSHQYVSLDDPQIRVMANRDPSLFLDNFQPPLIIDEIQYAPQLLSHIKIAIDNHRSQKGLFLLTGSQNFPLMAGVGESLAGRIAVFTLLTFSMEEQLKTSKEITLPSLKTKVFKGGFPEVSLNKNIDAGLWYASYMQTYLERDIRQIRQVGDINDFQRFLQLLAAFNGQIINLSSLSRDLGIAVNTVKAWLSVMEASNQIILLKPFYINRSRRIVKNPKVYFLDTGLLCYLNGFTTSQQVFKGPGCGQLFETVVLGEIMRGFYNKGMLPTVFFWKTSYGEEVDFIVEKQGKLIPIEVKLSSHTREEMAKGLISFRKLFSDKISKSYIVNLSHNKISLRDSIEVVPFSNFVREDCW